MNNFGIIKNICKVTLKNESTKNKWLHFKGGVISIFLGLFVSSLLIIILGKNPFDFFEQTFDYSFNLFRDDMFQWITVFLIAAVAVSIGFKSGVFNIGVPGQMLGAFFIALYMYRKVYGITGTESPTLIQNLVVIIVAISFSTLLGGIAGLLKDKFNIHEVVTTIMLNWIVWYFFKNIIASSSTGQTEEIPKGILNAGDNTYIIPMIISIMILIGTVVIFSKTTFGMKLKAVGLSKDAAKNAGIDVNAKIIQSLSLSGGVAGVAGLVWGFTTSPQINISNDVMPSIGFDAIAISLVAFNNPIGILGVSILWAILKIGDTCSAPVLQMPSQTGSLIFGLTVCFSSMSSIFFKISIKKEWFKIKSKKHKDEYNKVLDTFFEEYENAKTELTARKHDAFNLYFSKKNKFKILRSKLNSKLKNSKEQAKANYVSEIKFQKGFFEKNDKLIEIKDVFIEKYNYLKEEKIILKNNYQIEKINNEDSISLKANLDSNIKKINDEIKLNTFNYKKAKNEVIENYKISSSKFNENKDNINELKANYLNKLISLKEEYKVNIVKLKEEKIQYFESLEENFLEIDQLKSEFQNVENMEYSEIIRLMKKYNEEKNANLLVIENENLKITKLKLKIYIRLNRIIKKQRIDQAYKNYLDGLNDIKGENSHDVFN